MLEGIKMTVMMIVAMIKVYDKGNSKDTNKTINTNHWPNREKAKRRREQQKI